MLQQLAGIGFGRFSGCDDARRRPANKTSADTFTLEQVLRERTADLNCPVIADLPVGHGSGGNAALPVGVQALLDGIRVPECGDAVSTLTEDGLRHREIKWRGDLDVGGPGIENPHMPAQPLKQGSVVSHAQPRALASSCPCRRDATANPCGVCAAQSSARSGVSAITPWASTRLIVSVTGVAAITAPPSCTARAQRFNSADSTRQRAPS